MKNIQQYFAFVDTVLVVMIAIFTTIAIDALPQIFFNVRPGFYSVPFQYKEIKVSELRLQTQLEKICDKIIEPYPNLSIEKCKNYRIVVFGFSILEEIRFFINSDRTTAMSRPNTEWIFFNKYIIDKIDESAIGFLIAHELGHHLLVGFDEYGADLFAARIVGAENGIRLYKSIAKALGWNPYLEGKILRLEWFKRTA